MAMHAPTPERVGRSAGGSSPTQRMPDMDALYSRLAEADEGGDAGALAALAWELYGLLGLDEDNLNSLRARLHQLLAPNTSKRGLRAPGPPGIYWRVTTHPTATQGHSDGAGACPQPRGSDSGAAEPADFRDREGIRRPGSRSRGERGQPWCEPPVPVRARLHQLPAPDSSPRGLPAPGPPGIYLRVTSHPTPTQGTQRWRRCLPPVSRRR